jgi:hypothetical protein
MSSEQGCLELLGADNFSPPPRLLGLPSVQLPTRPPTRPACSEVPSDLEKGLVWFPAISTRVASPLPFPHLCLQRDARRA